MAGTMDEECNNVGRKGGEREEQCRAEKKRGEIE